MQLGETYTVRASSELKSANNAYAAKKVIPPSLGTAWCEGAAGAGMGEWIELTLKEPFTNDGGFKLGILPGFASTHALFGKNNRPKKLAVIINDDPAVKEITLEDYAKFQSFVFEWPDKPVNKIRLKILEVYKGEQANDTCITDITVWKWPIERGSDYLDEWHAWMGSQVNVFKGVKWKQLDRDSMSVVVGYTESRFYSPDGGESRHEDFLDAFMQNPALFLSVLDKQSDAVVKNVTEALLNPINETYPDPQIRSAITKGLEQIEPAARERLKGLRGPLPTERESQ
ncbi:MAG TPA: hypothetical protein VIU46_08105 [Gallionellaceae bacterium]